MKLNSRKSKRNRAGQRVSIEVSARELAMIIVDRSGGEMRRVRGEHVAWLEEATSLDSPDGSRELAAALTHLANAEKLAGADVAITLSSDFCVTRVVAGEAAVVDRELRSLRERSKHYLWLGAGSKAQAESSRAVDAKHVQSWLSVTNDSILQTIVQAANRANLQVDFMEHSMVSVCRALGSQGFDADGPVILAELNNRGVDLGVSFRGQLLFDYRPGGLDIKERIGEIVARHLERIQRYCDRHFRFTEGKKISTVFLYGKLEEATRLQSQFKDSTQLTAEVVGPRNICPDVKVDEDIAADSRYVSALGCALVDEDRRQQSQQERGFPDLMDYFRQAWKEPLVPTLVRLAWPIAAAILVAVGIYSAALVEHGKADAIESQVQVAEQGRARVRELKLGATEAMTKAKYLDSIDRQLMNPAWHNIVAMIGQSLPQGAWLDSVRIEDLGLISVTGTAPTEQLVLDFVDRLQGVSGLDRVNLEAQRPTRSPLGLAISFDIKCNFSGHDDHAHKVARND
jgi:hypothetical protein